MKGRQFEQFSNEVLTQGAAAVLPQNLPERWLHALLEEADIFQASDGTDVDNTCAGLLSAVLMILSAQHGYPETLEIPGETLMRSLSYYIITITAESVSRHTDIWVEPPTLENIFQEDRTMKAIRKPSEAD
jgi:hypothetical protein